MFDSRSFLFTNSAVWLRFVRYGSVGVFSNLVAYLAYLGLTFAGLGHKLAATIVFVLCVMLGFVFNARWSAGLSRIGGDHLFRYVTAYLLGYVVYMLFLLTFVDWVGWPHWLVQPAGTVLVAILLLLLQEFWVFARR